MTKTCLIIIDGLRDDTARKCCNWLMMSVAKGDARLWTMQACLPTISAPLYETIHTGLAPADHGLMDNEGLRPCPHPNVFSALQSAGKTSGVVGHSYFHSLFAGSAFDPFDHVEVDDPHSPITHGRYYSMDGYDADNAVQPAEVDLCGQLWGIARRHAPDYLLLHSSSCDTLGHTHTGLGAAYERQAGKVDKALAQLIPRLREAGYQVLITADHGMDEHGDHGGDAPSLVNVPFFAFDTAITAPEGQVLDQRALAPTILSLLGVAAPDTMKAAPLA
ncbi:MAG: alkaline phosphatase family protein [Pseudomonadota bacterium]|nr:alkaline phosphatase family protein [Pseudomonadota bacterium]MEC8293115.1 alkaline phosphatase family protein [Pseudomonadota bacterium]